MLMRLVWPILEPPRGLFDLIDIAVDDVEELIREQGYEQAGIPEQWEVELGPRCPGFEEHRLVLTCVVEVAAALEEAA